MQDDGGFHYPLASADIPYKDDKSFEHNLFALLFLPLVCVIGFIGNGMVCISIATDRRLQNITNYFLFSLALADLLVSAIVMPLAILAEVRHGLWTWSYSLCFLYVYSDVFLCSASIVHMSMISLDRFLGISQPLKNRNKSRNMVIFKICIVWLITTVISSPLAGLAIYDPQTILFENRCAITNRLYMLYGSILSFLIPFIIMTVTYIKTTQLLNKQANLLSQKTNDRFHNGLRRTLPHRKLGYASSYSMGTSQGNNSATGHKTSVISYNSYNVATSSIHHTPKQSTGETKCLLQSHNSSSTDTEELQQKISTDPNSVPKLEKQSSTLKLQIGKLKTRTSSVLTSITTKVNRKNSLQTASMELANEHKATRVLAVVFICFFICWTPFFLANFAYAMFGEKCEIPDWLTGIFLWLGYMSSTINPIIYTIFNRRFRQAFLRILRCQCMHPYRDHINYSRTHTHIPPETHTWSNFDKSLNSNGKDFNRTSPGGLKNTTAIGLIAAGSRAISAPAGPLPIMLPTMNPMDFFPKNDQLESPDSIDSSSIEWNEIQQKQILSSQIKNGPVAFPKNVDIQTIEDRNLVSPASEEKRINTISLYRNRPEEKEVSKVPDNPLQTSDYDNLKSEFIKRHSSESLDCEENHAENLPLINYRSNGNPIQQSSPKRFLFSSFKNSPIINRGQETCSKCDYHHIPRSISDNFNQKPISPTISKKSVIKSTTVTEQLYGYSHKLNSSTNIVIPSLTDVIQPRQQRPSDVKIRNSTNYKSGKGDTKTLIDTTVQSGLLLRSNDRIHETYL